MGKDYYEILGFSESEKKLQGAEFDKLLKKKYRSLCLKWHPDKFATKSEEEKKKAEEKFKDISEANDVLSDASKRRMYDFYGTADNTNSSTEFDKYAEEFFNNFAKRNNFDGFDKSATFVYKGSDKEIKVNITLDELFKGGTKDISFNIKKPCSKCNGSGVGKNGKIVTCAYCHGTGYETITQRNAFGFVRESHPCPHCKGSGHSIHGECSNCGGTGIEDSTVRMSISIPNIIDSRKRFVKRGAGNAGEHNGINGDLYITYNITNSNHTDFNIDTSEGDAFTLTKMVEINVIDCMIGLDTFIKHIDGRIINYNVKPCTKDGDCVIIKNEGLPKPNGGRGNLKIIIKCKMPNSLTKEDIKLLNKLKKSTSFN